MKTITENAQMFDVIVVDAPGDKITLKVDVLYVNGDGRRFTLNGYHYPGQPWTMLAYAERLQFTESELMFVLERRGWGIAGRPVRQNGMAYNYFLERNADSLYSLKALDVADAERKAQRRIFKELFLVEEMERDFEEEGING